MHDEVLNGNTKGLYWLFLIPFIHYLLDIRISDFNLEIPNFPKVTIYNQENLFLLWFFISLFTIVKYFLSNLIEFKGVFKRSLVSFLRSHMGGIYIEKNIGSTYSHKNHTLDLSCDDFSISIHGYNDGPESSTETFIFKFSKGFFVSSVIEHVSDHGRGTDRDEYWNLEEYFDENYDVSQYNSQNEYQKGVSSRGEISLKDSSFRTLFLCLFFYTFFIYPFLSIKSMDLILPVILNIGMMIFVFIHEVL